MNGYSGTPLSKKLGIKDGHNVALLSAPATFRALLNPLPPDVVFTTSANAKTDIAHVFVTERAKLSKHLETLRDTLASNAVVWVSWPKKASKVQTDITEDTIREVALPMGWVDIKVCAVDEVWSGLKLMVRKELR